MTSASLSPSPTRLVRTRLTWLVYLQLGVYGYFLYGLGPSLPLLRAEQHVSRTLSALHGTALAAGTLVTGLVFVRVVARLGRGATMWVGIAGLVGGVLVFSATTALPATLAAITACGLFGSFVVNGSAAILTDGQTGSGPAALSEANATAAGCGLLAPLLVGFAVSRLGDWRPGLLVVVGLAAVVAILLGRVRTPDARRTPPASAAATGPQLPRRYWVAWMVLLLLISVEFCMTLWTSDLLATRGASPGAAAAGVTAVVAGMFAGRLLGGRVALRIDSRRLLLGAIAVAAVGFAVFWLSATAVPAYAGLLLCGLGIALHFPLGIARAMEVSGGLYDLASGRSSWAAGVAAGGGPFALGALADHVGTRSAFLIVPALLGMAGLLVASLRTPAGRASARSPA